MYLVTFQQRHCPVRTPKVRRHSTHLQSDTTGHITQHSEPRWVTDLPDMQEKDSDRPVAQRFGPGVSWEDRVGWWVADWWHHHQLSVLTSQKYETQTLFMFNGHVFWRPGSILDPNPGVLFLFANFSQVDKRDLKICDIITNQHLVGGAYSVSLVNRK